MNFNALIAIGGALGLILYGLWLRRGLKRDANYWWRLAALLSWVLIVTVMLVFIVAMVAQFTSSSD